MSDQGTNVFGRERDFLLVFDVCRGDLLKEALDEYDFRGNCVSTLTSVGSSSREWFENTFAERYSSERALMAYITGNPFSTEFIDSNDLAQRDEFWRYACPE